MRQIAGYIRSFFAEQGNVPFFLLQGVFYAAAVWVNYTWDVERSAVRSLDTSWRVMAWYAGFYALPFVYTLLTYAWCYHVTGFLRSGRFWFLAVFTIAALSFNGGFRSLVPLVRTWFAPPVQYFAVRCANNLTSTIIYVTLITAYWRVKDRPEMPLYGLSTGEFRFRPFALIVLLVCPLIVAASFLPDFLASYPRMTNTQAADFWGVPRALPVAIYEVCYGLDFFATEFFFRGLMVLAFSRFLGPAAVFPMVSVYLFLHFEKPAAEAISSVFGGLALGIIAYRTRSIFGGVVIHLGVAWMMEAAAYAQMMFR
jgi:hypothetical protein